MEGQQPLLAGLTTATVGGPIVRGVLKGEGVMTHSLGYHHIYYYASAADGHQTGPSAAWLSWVWPVWCWWGMTHAPRILTAHATPPPPSNAVLIPAIACATGTASMHMALYYHTPAS